MTNSFFNDRLRQLMLLFVILLLGWLLLKELVIFLPGLLGGVTLYILSRSWYFQLAYRKKWKKGWTALLFIIVYLIIIALPIYFCIELISPKISELSNNQEKVVKSLNHFSDKITELTGLKVLTPETIRAIPQKISAYIPKLLNSTFSVITNLLIMFFLLYYLLTCGREVERYLNKAIPLKPQNVDKLASETKTMIRASALGIPIICVVQGVFAAFGYWIFGIEEWGLWGFVTGVFAYFPLVGT
ncbi:MAG: AI-2E family transporter, partial [Ferruginibacter sp.]